MDKKTDIRSKKIATIRGWIQAAATLLTNIHIPNLWKGKIYQGNAKTICVPGLNCYSCPAATGSCQILHGQTQTSKIPEIYHPSCFRYTSSDACNELHRNGRSVLLQIYLSARCFGGCHTAVTRKCRYTICTGKAVFFQMSYPDRSRDLKHYILQTFL